MNPLRKIRPVWVKDTIFVVFLLLYMFGPLQAVASYLPLLWSIPAIFMLTSSVWSLVELLLSEKRVDPYKKAIFISGCDSGFGFELVKHMAHKGFDVIAGCLKPDDGGAILLRSMQNVSVVELDVTKEDRVSNIAELIGERLKRENKVLWAVVANAGLGCCGPFEWTTIREIERMFDVNVYGCIRTAKAFLPLLRESRGRFVVSGSLSGIHSFQNGVPYSMGKAAVKSLTEGLTRELSPSTKIHFACVMPTFHDTPMVRQATADEIDRKYHALPESLRDKIGLGYLKKIREEIHMTIKSLTLKDLSRTIAKFDHALTSTRPRFEYISDTWLFEYVVWPLLKHFPVDTLHILFEMLPARARLLHKFKCS
ncbi:D-beta-hydroxybutyrate dehydrogenase, mitochondrial [Galendromus occidentalis]|uniref:D-beta-hydroxybutyrate dehydrogenase, mitochondrial n=1 Tax=Galendromus occidentalis TaxID=34638 RepID=A0AAJ6QRB5_9ACAR|nr:D-beta-hydroxybutyrate dehydrogenase, mitochondrial [Galendromus occidentalis]